MWTSLNSICQLKGSTCKLGCVVLAAEEQDHVLGCGCDDLSKVAQRRRGHEPAAVTIPYTLMLAAEQYTGHVESYPHQGPSNVDSTTVANLPAL